MLKLVPKTAEIQDDTPRAVVVRDLIEKIRQEFNVKFLELGCLLVEARRQNYARQWGYTALDHFVEKEVGIGARTGRYLMEIYTLFVEEHKVDRAELAEIGWTKLSKLLPVAATTKQMTKWLNDAKEHTVRQVDMAVREELGAVGEERQDIRSTWSVLVTPGQRKVINDAVEIARRQNGSENAGDALEAIAADFLAGANAA